MAHIQSNRQEVRTRLSVHRLSAIDLQNQQFTAVFSLEVSWVDFELKHEISKWRADNPDTASTDWEPDAKKSDQLTSGLFIKFPGDNSGQGSQPKLGPYFTPKVFWKNMLAADESEEWFALYDDHEYVETEPYVVCFRMKQTATFQEQLELRLFPVDIQDLTFQMQSLCDQKGQSGKVVSLTQNMSSRYISFVNPSTFIQSSEYNLRKEITFEVSSTKAEESASCLTYPLLKMKLSVERKCSYWVLNVVIPLFFIVCCSVVSYVLPPQDLADRLSVSLTLLLTMIAFKFIIADKLPPISYLTLLDGYILLCFMCMVLLVFAQGYVGMQLRMEEREQAIAARLLQQQPGNSTTVGAPPALTCKDTDNCEGNPLEAVRNLMVSWTVLHALFCLAYCCLALIRPGLKETDKKRTTLSNVLWVGPAVDADGKGQASWRQLLGKYGEGAAAPNKDAIAVTTAVNAFLQSSSNGKDLRGKKSKAAICTKATLWSPESCKAAIRSAGIELPDGQIPSSCFMVVEFSSPDWAKRATTALAQHSACATLAQHNLPIKGKLRVEELWSRYGCLATEQKMQAYNREQTNSSKNAGKVLPTSVVAS